MTYNYTNVNQIDNDTLDYLNFVSPKPVENMNIIEINNFLTELEKMFEELDKSSPTDYVGEEDKEIGGNTVKEMCNHE